MSQNMQINNKQMWLVEKTITSEIWHDYIDERNICSVV